jgi:PPK2 family polyphosphate:nucleotide phosphotransferase
MTGLIDQKYIDMLRVAPGAKVKIADYDPGWKQSEELEELGKEEVKERALEILEANRERLRDAQRVLYADNRYSVLIVLQALDAAGKDGTIRHVMSGVNPQGCRVYSFKRPSMEELEHNFLWRYARALPERGCIGIFNRSYYEEVLVVKVHPAFLDAQRLPDSKYDKKFWDKRYRDINAFEEHLVDNGTVVIKFFLNISKGEQKKRFLDRLDDPEKHWKFSSGDLAERGYWGDYMSAFEDALSATSTKAAPWYVIPANAKWIARTLVADIITSTILNLKLSYPKVSDEEKKRLAEARAKLEAE